MVTRHILIILVCLALIPNVQAAMSTTVTQAGADPGTIMKGKTFTVTASGWSGSCNQADIDLSQCTVCSVTESETKSVTGQTTVSWTTVTSSGTATGQKVTVTVSEGCSSDYATSTSFNIVLPPNIEINSYSPTSYSDPSGSKTINLNIKNSGETTANDVSATLTLPSGVSTSDSLTQTESELDPEENWGTSWTVSFSGSVSDSDIEIYISSSNADSKTITIHIDVTEPYDPGGNGNGNGNGFVGPGPTPQNGSQRPVLVPGVGLRNNTNLLAAVEKVLAKGKLSDQAKENLLRLSASITSDISTTRWFNVSGGKSKITTTMRYQGQKKAMNFILFESVPKTFANNASLVTVNAPGATVEVAEEMDTGQEITVTYEVSGLKTAAVLDGMTTEIYASSLEEEPITPPSTTCTAGTKRCSGDNLQQCSTDGTAWETTEACTYGCDSSTLRCKSSAPPLAGLEEIPWTIIAGVVIVAALVVVAVVVYLKKFKKSGGGSPVSALESVKQDLGQQTQSE
jgi:hypothetical protein